MSFLIFSGFLTSSFSQGVEELFQKGIQLEEGDGNLAEAIKVYQLTVADKNADRTIRANALYHIGLCYEKMGRGEAQKAYQQLVSDFGDQTEIVALAREKLSRLMLLAEEVSKTPLVPKFTRIEIPISVNSSIRLSPDGNNLVQVLDNKLWKIPVSGNLGPKFSGIPVQLNTEGIDAEDSGLSWSGNGKWIAFNEYPIKDKPEQGIFIVSSKGGKPKKVVENYRDVRYINYRISLSPNGKNLSFSTVEDKKQYIQTVAIEGGNPKKVVNMQSREPVYSPNGKMIAFVEDKNAGRGEGGLGLWLVEANGGNPRLIADAGRASCPVWSPDGEMIAYLDKSIDKQINIVTISKDSEVDGNVTSIDAPEGIGEVKILAGWTTDNKIGALLTTKEEYGLYTLSSKGGQAAMVLHNCNAMQPRWSHDGKQIFYTTPPKDGINSVFDREIASVSSNGGIGKPLPQDKEGRSIRHFPFQGGIHVSPDGKTIISAAFTPADLSSELSTPKSRIWKIAIDGSESIQITNIQGPYADGSPCWSPDGEKVAFVRLQLSEGMPRFMGIYIINSSGGEPEVLVSTPGKFVVSLAWSPDGKEIACLTNELMPPNTKALSVVNVSNGELRVAGEVPIVSTNTELDWSPDSKRIAFNDAEGKVIKIMNLEDGSIEDITTGLVDIGIYNLDWSPDGERFVFGGVKERKQEFWMVEDFLPLSKLPQKDEKENKEFKIRQAWADYELYSQGAPSPDGRYISYVHYDTGDLGILEIATGKKRRLTNKGTYDESDEFAEYSRWSPDGKQIVYDWYNEKGFIELRIIGLDGSKPRILYKNEEVTWARTYGWSPDGKQILACFSRNDGPEQIVLVSVDDGSVRILKTLGEKWPKNMNFSPDGRYIVYDFPQKENSPKHDISLLSTGGGSEVKLVEHRANDYVLGWTPDGKNILFASDRTGNLSAWLIAVANGKPQGTPELIKSDIGQFSTMGFTRDGSFYYNSSGEFTRDIFSVKIDPESGEILNQPRKLIEYFEGHNLSPDYSPDGKHLVYTRRTIGDVLCIRSLETGEEQEFKLKLKQIELPRWSPDGKSIIIAGRGENNLWKLYLLNTQTGNLTFLASPQDDMRVVGRHEWSPDGKTIFYGQRSKIKNRTQIMHRNIESGTERELFLGSNNNPFYLSCSPDGKWLAFFMKGQTELKIMPVEGGQARELFSCKRGDHLSTLRWTNDGKYILFVILPSGNSVRQPDQNKCTLWRIPAMGGKPEKLGLEINYTQHLSIHPDGQHIAYYNFSTRISKVWVMENFLPKN